MTCCSFIHLFIYSFVHLFWGRSTHTASFACTTPWSQWWRRWQHVKARKILNPVNIIFKFHIYILCVYIFLLTYRRWFHFPFFILLWLLCESIIPRLFINNILHHYHYYEQTFNKVWWKTLNWRNWSIC